MSAPTVQPSEAAFRMARVGRHSAVYLGGVLLSKAAAFLLLPLYTRYLTPSDYGVLQLIDITMEVLSIVAGSRLGAGIFLYYHNATSDAERRRLIGSAFAVIATFFAIVGALAFAAAPRLAILMFGTPAYANLLRISSVSLALQGGIIVPQALLQVREQSGVYVVANSIKALLQMTLNVVLLTGMHLAAKGMVLSTLAANIATAGFLTVVLVRAVGLPFERKDAVRIIRFGAPFIATHLARFLVTYGDRFILQALFGTAVVGVYGLAYQFGFLLAMLADGPFRTAWEPLRFEIAKRPRAERDAIFTRAFTVLNLLTFSLAVFLSVLVPEFLRVMATPPFYPAAPWVPVILLAYVAQSWSLFLNTGLYVRERADQVTSATWIGAVVTFAAYGLLIPPLGGMGAALATLLGFASLAWIVWRKSQQAWPITLNWSPTRRLVAVAVGVIAASYAVPSLPLLASLSVKLTLLAAYGAVVWRAGILRDGDKALVLLAIRNPRAALSVIGR